MNDKFQWKRGKEDQRYHLSLIKANTRTFICHAICVFSPRLTKLQSKEQEANASYYKNSCILVKFKGWQLKDSQMILGYFFQYWYVNNSK